MNLTKTDSQKMQRLAQEGKRISKIVKEDFPSLSYWDVYVEVYGAGQRSSLGVKRMITRRINDVVKSTKKSERRDIAEELHELVWHLYRNHKTSTEKLAKFREVLGE
jgi:hypothetical protein